jgi:hypothetical protein
MAALREGLDHDDTKMTKMHCSKGAGMNWLTQNMSEGSVIVAMTIVFDHNVCITGVL